MKSFRRVIDRSPADGEAWEKQGRHMPNAHLGLDLPYRLLLELSDGILPEPDRISAWNDRPTFGREFRHHMPQCSPWTTRIGCEVCMDQLAHLEKKPAHFIGFSRDRLATGRRC